MNMLVRGTLMAMILGLATAPAAAKEAAATEAAPQSCAADLSLLEVVTKAGRRLNKKFLIDPRLGPCVALGQPIDAQRISYRELQALLALHGFIDKMEVDGVISIVPDGNARLLPVRLIDDSARDVGEFEMVMKIVDPSPLNAAYLVPILRPLLPQYGHLVADGQTNAMIVVARYGSVRTIEAMIRKLSQRPVISPRKDDRSTDGTLPAK